ncbi:hypothetical protein D1007_43334 [Hordeum vulgare]|nr:hypothetical protein D1007_43334 [Hordeum vulgare]
MADARRARAERRATRIAHTTSVGPTGVRRSPSPIENAATGPDVQNSKAPPSRLPSTPTAAPPLPSLVWASGSASRTRPEMLHGRRALAMATELLHYRSVPNRHNNWLQHIEELVAAAGDSAALLLLVSTPTVPRER